MLAPTNIHTVYVAEIHMHFSSASNQLCTAVDTSAMRIIVRNPSWIMGKIILLVNIFESKRVMIYNTTISHLHGRPCIWRPESWCGIDARVPQSIHCRTAAAGKSKCSKHCGGWRPSEIRQMKVKADLNITSSQFFTPSNLHTCMSLSQMHLCEFAQLSTNSLFRYRSQISGLIFRSAGYTDVVTKFKRRSRNFSSFEDNVI